ncbi:putative bifunctional diguanylate cyclase/phosphodiesterase [Marinomonas sp.]
MLTLRKRLSYKQAKWALVLLLILSILLSAYQVYSDWQAEKHNIANQVRATLDVIEYPIVEAAYALDEVETQKLLTGLIRSAYFHEAKVVDDYGIEIASAYHPTEKLPFHWLINSVFTGLEHTYHLPLYHDPAIWVGTLTVQLDADKVVGRFIGRNLQLVATVLSAIVILGAGLLTLFYFLSSRPLNRLIDQLSYLEDDVNDPEQVRFAHTSREDELGILSRNITALWHKRKRVEGQLAKSEAYFKAVLHQSSECMLLADLQGQILDCNSETCRLLGYDAEALQQLTIDQVDAEQTPQWLTKWATESPDTAKTFETEYMRSDQQCFPVEVRGNIIMLEGEAHFLASFRDITQRKKDQEQVQFLAYYDALTSLPNRRLLNENLEKALEEALQQGHVGALLFIDLDRFKAINDSMGHHTGDALLVEVAKRITTELKEHDTVARIGGDEFVILLPQLGSNIEEAEQKGARLASILLNMLSQAFYLNQAELFISASIGVSLFPAEQQDDLPILQQADTAMYEAKDNGRNGYRFYRPEMQQQLAQRLMMEKALHQAMKEDEFYLLYQPQVDEQGNIIGAEALLRWHNDALGNVSPYEFIPIAEEIGLIDELGRWVLDTACVQLKQWQDQGLPATFVSMAVNISPYQFSKEGFVQDVLQVIEEHQIVPSLLDLEITEGMLVENIASVAEKMCQLKERGVRFSIDDFGTGYSSLRYLQHFPLTRLKIDQSFVRDISADPSSHVIINTIISMANHMKFSVLAEGVETLEERDILASIGCHRYQGYYFSRPVTADIIADYLFKQTCLPALPSTTS